MYNSTPGVSSRQPFPVNTTPPSGTLTGPSGCMQVWGAKNQTIQPVDFRIQVAVTSQPQYGYGTAQFDMRNISLAYTKSTYQSGISTDIGQFYVGSQQITAGSKFALDMGGGASIRWKPATLTKSCDLRVAKIEWRASYGGRSMYGTVSHTLLLAENDLAYLGLGTVVFGVP
jgi:hypothetical protein